MAKWPATNYLMGSRLEMKVTVSNEPDEVVYQASLKFRGETAEEMKPETAEAAKKSKN